MYRFSISTYKNQPLNLSHFYILLLLSYHLNYTFMSYLSIVTTLFHLKYRLFCHFSKLQHIQFGHFSKVYIQFEVKNFDLKSQVFHAAILYLFFVFIIFCYFIPMPVLILRSTLAPNSFYCYFVNLIQLYLAISFSHIS